MKERAKLDADCFWLHKFRATFATKCDERRSGRRKTRRHSGLRNNKWSGPDFSRTRPSQFTHPFEGDSNMRMYSMTESDQPSMCVHLP